MPSVCHTNPALVTCDIIMTVNQEKHSMKNKTKIIPLFSKGLVIRLLIFAVTLSPFTSCLTDEDWSKFADAWDDVVIPPSPPARMTINVDSIEHISSSRVKVWLHVNFDSVFVFFSSGVSYWETENAVSSRQETFQQQDTIDCRMFPGLNYRYHVEVDSLQPATSYALCAFLDHIVRNDTVRVAGSVYDQGCARLKTK